MSASPALIRTLAVALIFAACTACADGVPTGARDPSASIKAAVTGVTVMSARPDSSTRDTTLDVTIAGSGFDNGSNVNFAQGGVVDPRLRVNRTTFKSSSQVVANVTIAANADLAKYDVAVTTTGGKKGIGSELFAVVPSIAYFATTGLAVMNFNGTNQTVIAPWKGAFQGGTQPRWSPDGSKIWVDRWVIDVSFVNGKPTGSNLHQVPIVFPAGVTNPGATAWSPVADQIVTTALDGSVGAIFVAPAVGGTAIRVYTSPAGFIPTWPDWSPDGTRLVFTEWPTNLGAHQAEFSKRIVVLDLATSAVTVIKAFTDLDVVSPHWSHGGDRIAFSGADTAHVSSIWTIAATGGTPVRVVAGLQPAWSPDDSQLAFYTLTTSKGGKWTYAAYSITLATGATQLLVDGGRAPDWRR